MVFCGTATFPQAAFFVQADFFPANLEKVPVVEFNFLVST